MKLWITAFVARRKTNRLCPTLQRHTGSKPVIAERALTQRRGSHRDQAHCRLPGGPHPIVCRVGSADHAHSSLGTATALPASLVEVLESAMGRSAEICQHEASTGGLLLAAANRRRRERGTAGYPPAPARPTKSPVPPATRSNPVAGTVVRARRANPLCRSRQRRACG